MRPEVCEMFLSATTSIQNQLRSFLMSGTEARRHIAAGDLLTAFNDSRIQVVMLAIVVSLGTTLLAFVAAGAAQPVLLTLLSLLAVMGVFFLLAAASGAIRLAEGEQSLQAAAVADAVPEALEVTRPDGTPLWANGRYRVLIGSGIPSGVNGLEQALGGTPPVAEALFRLSRAAAAGESAHEDVVATLPNAALGRTRERAVVRIAVSTFRAPPGAAVAAGEPLVLWRIADRTEDSDRKIAAVAELREALQGYDALPVGAIAADADGTVARINAIAAGWLGYQETRRTSLRLSDIVAADGAELLMTAASRDDDAVMTVDLDFVREDGVLLPVRVLCRAAPAPLTRAPGESERARGIVLAFVEQASVEAPEARGGNSGLRFARAVRSAPLGVATIARDGSIASSNAAFVRMMGGAKGSLEGAAHDVLGRTADADTRAALRAGLDRVLAGRGNVAPIEITVGAKGEFTRRVYMSPLQPMKTASEQAILYVVDITEQKALEAKFAQSQKMEAVGKLAGFVAHDFNNMLTAIIGFSDFLLQTHKPTDPAHSDIINIKSSASRAAGLVGKLLALARQQTLLVEPLQLGEVMTDLAPLLKRSIGEKIELRMSSGRDLWFVRTDKLQLEQAIINLAVNARDAMADGGRLSIKTRNVSEREAQRLQLTGMPAAEYVLIEVEDSGTGMPPEVLEKIFEPFFTTKAPGKGTGLGLATVYGIVKQTGGYIYPESQPGKGTTFRIFLPRYILDERDEAAFAEKLEAGKRVQKADLTGTGRVLLVEDEDVVRSFAVRALTRQGYQVLEATDGLQALEVMAQNRGEIDIVVSDVVMPGMDGPTMLKELRKTNPDLKIIFVSGYPNEAFQQALGEETFAFLPKPFSLPQLAAKVKEQLGR